MFRRLSLSVVFAIVSTSSAWAQAGASAGRTVATFDGVGANAWGGNVRVSDADLVALLEEGVRKSPTLRGLTERLAKSDVIVYVRPDVAAKDNAPSRLTFLSSSGGFRYLVIRVRPNQTKPQQLAMLGHDMQHAVSIADASSVVDSQSLKREFERIGKVRQISLGDDYSFDSPAALDIKRRVLSEVKVDSGKPAPRVASATR